MAHLTEAVILAATLMLAGCQSYVDAQGRTHLTTGPLLASSVPQGPVGPGSAFVPDTAIVAGVQSFQETLARDGMAGVQTVAIGCRDSARRGFNRGDIPQCFAFDVAAMMVAISHDRVHHTKPLPDLNLASFRRRFVLYQGALGVPPSAQQQVEDSVFSRDAAMLSAGRS